VPGPDQRVLKLSVYGLLSGSFFGEPVTSAGDRTSMTRVAIPKAVEVAGSDARSSRLVASSGLTMTPTR
jgi:hypothetical protein